MDGNGDPWLQMLDFVFFSIISKNEHNEIPLIIENRVKFRTNINAEYSLKYFNNPI